MPPAVETSTTAGEWHTFAAGCPRRHELVQVRVPGAASPLGGRVVVFDCPCGEEHSALDLYGRLWHPGDPYAATGTPLGRAEVRQRPAAPTALAKPARHTVSDAAILAALGPEPRPGAEVAEALGYSEASALMSRVRRMVKRAEAKGERPAILIERAAGTGRAVLLRLAPCGPVDSVTQERGRTFGADRQNVSESGSDTDDPPAEHGEMSP